MLSAGVVVTIEKDRQPGRKYHITGQAYGDGWWAFPLDGGEVDAALQRLSNSSRAAWVKETEVAVVGKTGIGIERAQPGPHLPEMEPLLGI